MLLLLYWACSSSPTDVPSPTIPAPKTEPEPLTTSDQTPTPSVPTIPVTCGELVGGSFDRAAVSSRGVDLTETSGYVWLSIALPPVKAHIQQITAHVSLDDRGAAYVLRPGRKLNETDFFGQYVGPSLVSGTSSVLLHPGTDPSLQRFRELQSPIHLLVASDVPSQRWTVTVECSDLPVFENPVPLPFELGEPFAWDFDAWGPPGTRIFTEDPLPDWVTFNEATAEIHGIAAEPGGWDFTLVAELPDGRRTEAASLVGVVDVEELGCDESARLTTEETYFQGDIATYHDPRGYRVYRLELPLSRPSQVDVLVESSEQVATLTVPRPTDASQPYLPTGLMQAGPAGRTALSVSLNEFPGIVHYDRAGELYLVVGPYVAEEPYTLSVSCDRLPQVVHLPVLDSTTEADSPISVVGGLPPYTLSADGLPSGLWIENGRLRGSASPGTYDISVTVTDATNAMSTGAYPLVVGHEVACSHADEILSCGETLTGQLGGPETDDRLVSLCTVGPSDVASLSWTVDSPDAYTAALLGQPNAVESQILNVGQRASEFLVARGTSETFTLNAGSWPPVIDYRDQAATLVLYALESTAFTVTLTCP